MFFVPVPHPLLAYPLPRRVLQVAAVRAELQRQVGEAQALAEIRVAAMRDMQDKIQHLNARVGCGYTCCTRCFQL